MTTMDAARDYIRRGWAPIPVPARSKKPIVNGWQNLRLKAEDLDRFFSRQANIGILMGGPSGWLVDIDLDHPLAVEMADDYLPQTPAIFGRPGKPRSHRLFRVTAPVETHKRQGQKESEIGMIVELRSTGAQTIFPPSIHESGEAIAWESDVPPADIDPETLIAAVNRLADAVLERLGVTPAPRPQPPRRDMSPVFADLPERIRRAEKYLAAIPGAISGQGGHDQTWSAALAVVRGFDLPEREAYDLLMSGFNHRCEPPWSDKELMHKVADAARSNVAAGWLLKDTHSDQFARGRKLGVASSQTDPKNGVMGCSQPACDQFAPPIGGGASQTGRLSRIAMPSLRANYRPTAYLVDTLVPAGSVALVAGTPGIGKTWLSLSLGYSVALGRPFLGHFGCLQGRALVVLEEEDPNSVKERVDLLYAGMGISPEQGDSLPVEFLIQQGAQVVDSDGNLDTAFEDAIREYQPDLVVIDPLRRVHNLDENDSGSMSGLFSIFRQMTHIPDNLCSVVVVHHLRKASELDQGLDRLRGSSDIAASVDSVLEVSGEFGNLRVRHAKSKRGPAAGAFLVLNAKCDGVKMEYVDPEKKAEQEREDVRGFIIAMLRENPGGCNQSALKELADARKMSYGKDRLKRVADELVKEGTVTATDGPRNSVVYLLSDQFVDGTRPPSTTSSNQFATPTHPPLANCSETDHAPPEDTL